MMRVCLLTLLISSVSSFLYVNPRCHEGPSYWCSSTEVAESCEATAFCQENIWLQKTDEKEVGNYVTCKACMWVFEKVESYILTEENEEKVLAWASKICDHIPESYNETCRSLISDYGKQAIQTLADKVGPAVVCKALGQCTASTELLSYPKSDTCSTCRSTMAEIKGQNTEFFSWWQNACGDVANTLECVKISETAQLLNQAILNDSICEQMEMC